MIKKTLMMSYVSVVYCVICCATAECACDNDYGEEIRELNAKFDDLKAENDRLKDGVKGLEATLSEVTNFCEYAKVQSKKPTEIIEHCEAMIKNKAFAKARSILETYVQKNPTSAYVGQMRFHIGETYFLEGNYPLAAKDYIKSHDASPKGLKAPNALCQLVHCLKLLGKTEEMNKIYKQLEKEHPNSSDSISKAKAIAQS